MLGLYFSGQPAHNSVATVNASLNALQQCPISHVNAFGREYLMNVELPGIRNS